MALYIPLNLDLLFLAHNLVGGRGGGIDEVGFNTHGKWTRVIKSMW